MAEIRLVRQEEFEEAVRLADAVFRDEAQSSMGEAFPGIFRNGLKQSWGAFEEGKLVSFMGLVPGLIRVGPARLRLYSLGSVCTHPDHRGKGYAGLLLEQALNHIERAGASLLLVSGDRSLYRRAGCLPFGSVKRYEITSNVSERLNMPTEEGQVRELQETDWFQVHRLAEAQNVRYESGVKEFIQLVRSEAYAGIFNMKHKIWVTEREGILTAFVVLALPTGIAPVKPPFLVQWGGDERDSLRLLFHAREVSGLPLLEADIPWHETEMHRLLEGASYSERKNEGTVKIVNVDRLWEQLAPYTESKESEKTREWVPEISEKGNGVRLTCDGVTVCFTMEELILLIFDPDFAWNGPQSVVKMLRDLVPVPLPYTAGLHYV